MGSLCKSSPKKQETKTETTSRSGPEQWVLDAGRQNYDLATAAAGQPYDPRTEGSVAGFSPGQQLAFQAVGDNQGAWRPGMEQASNVAGDLSRFSLSAENVEGAMNPYLQTVLANMEHDFQVRETTAYDDLSQWGVRGGRRGAREGVRAGAHERNMGDARFRAFEGAARNLQTQAGIQRGGAADLARYAGDTSRLGYGDASQQYGYGAIQQGQEQNVLNNEQQNAQQQFNFSFMMQQYLQNALRGTPTATTGESSGTSTSTQTQSGGDPSAIMQALYAAAVAGSFIPGTGGSGAPPTGPSGLPPPPAPPPPPAAPSSQWWGG